MTSPNQSRVRRLNGHAINGRGDYVLYWMQMYRRLDRNHALDYALKCSKELGKPLVIYEGLRLDYPFANARLHTFILEGMADNRTQAHALGVTYWPYVETPEQPARGLVRRIAEHATLVVTDDFPSFIVPKQSENLARAVSCPVYSIDSNGIVPLAMLGPPVSAAVHLRSRLQKTFIETWPHRAHAEPLWTKVGRFDPPCDLFTATDIRAFVARLPIDHSVQPVDGTRGGAQSATQRLHTFVADRLAGYAEHRSEPASPSDGHASGLSPYLHFGHIAIDAVIEAVLAHAGDFSVDALADRKRGKRDGYYSANVDASSFLDEAITWRDVGFHWHWHRRADTASLQLALPEWAKKTLSLHVSDLREPSYTRAQLEAGETYDPLWNAAQKELVATGTMHNYLRMLWGKKVIEWSTTPEVAYATLEYLNNKYALDGRDPNSYTGILWCFGLFDRPWPPERKIFGNVRYMSSPNTARKFDTDGYLAYVAGLPRTTG